MIEPPVVRAVPFTDAELVFIIKLCWLASGWRWAPEAATVAMKADRALGITVDSCDQAKALPGWDPDVRGPMRPIRA